MVTEKMIEAAQTEAEALIERAGIDIGDDHDMLVDDLAQTLIRFAAISTDAEPVLWANPEYMPKGDYLDACCPCQPREGGDFTLPLYAAPPAPSVAVKALEWGHTFGKSPVGQAMCYRVLFNENGAGWGYPEKGRGYYAEQDSGFLVSGPHETHDLAKAAAQAEYEARIRAALSAQVKDVP